VRRAPVAIFSSFFPQFLPKSMLTLRTATADDAALIVRFIKALADYENAEPHEFKTTEDNIRKYGFGSTGLPPRFRCEIADWNGVPAGFTLFFYNFSTWEGKHGIYLEDLLVLPEFRSFGIGFGLLKHLAQIAVEEDCTRIVWQVLDWNQLAIDFYESIGARRMGEWYTYRLEGSSVQALAGST
jgi:GNAT superfamily N-acetyltransferase